MEKINEVLVVEGKSDTQHLKQWFDVDTIETNGSEISDETISLIKKVNQSRDVIVLLDPDHSGEQIRKKIMAEIPTAKHAFISKKEGQPLKKGSLGIEHASYQAIKKALSQVMVPSNKKAPESLISNAVLRECMLIGYPNSKYLRQRVGEKLKIGYTNGKQLQKRLAMFQITEEQLIQTMKDIFREEGFYE